MCFFLTHNSIVVRYRIAVQRDPKLRTTWAAPAGPVRVHPIYFQTLKRSLVEIYSVQPREYRTSPYKLYGVVLAAYIWKVLSKVPTDYDIDPSLGVSGRFLSKYIKILANHISRSFDPQNISRHVLESPEWDLCTDHNSTFVRWNPKKTLLVKKKHTVGV